MLGAWSCKKREPQDRASAPALRVVPREDREVGFSVNCPKKAIVSVFSFRTVDRPNGSSVIARMSWKMEVATDSAGTTYAV